MRHSLWLGILCIFTATFLSAQRKSALALHESGEVQSAFKINYPISTYHNSKGETTVIRTKPAEFGKQQMLIFTMFTQPHQEKGRYWIELKNKDEFIGAIQGNDSIHAFVASPRRKGSRTLYRYSVSLDSPEHIKKPVMTFPTKGSDASIEFATTKDGNHFALVTFNPRENRKLYSLKVLQSSTFKEVYSHEFLNNNEQQTIINDVIITDDQHVYVIAKEYIVGKTERYNNMPNYRYRCYAFSPESSRKISVSRQPMYTPSLRLDLHQDEFRLIGYYSEKFKNNTLGICIIPMDFQQNKNLDIRFLPFSSQVKDDLGLGPRQHPNLSYIDHLIRDEYDNLYVIGEETHGDIRYYRFWEYDNPFFNPLFNPSMNFPTRGGPSVPEPRYTYETDNTLYQDIVIQKISQEGKPLWGKAINRRSNESFGIFLRNGELHFLINAREEPKPDSSGRMKFRYNILKSSALYHLTFSENGDFDYVKIKDNSEDYGYMPWLIETNNDFLIMPGMKNTYMRLMHIAPPEQPLVRNTEEVENRSQEQ